MQTHSPIKGPADRDPWRDPEQIGGGMDSALAELMAPARRPEAAKPTALMVGAAPPPYHGSIMMFWTLMTSPLQARFRLVHLDISDHRSLENMGRLDLQNVYLALRHALDCFRALKRERPEIVYVPLAWNPLAFLRDSVFLLLARAFAGLQKRSTIGGKPSKQRPRFKCVIHVHGGHFDGFYRACPAFFRAYVRWCLRGVDAAIVHSDALAPMFAGLLPLERVWPVSNGIEGAPDNLLERGYRSRSPSPGVCSPRKVLFLGNLNEAKGFLDVMAAAPIVSKAIPDVRFVIAGPYHRPVDREQAERLLRDPEIREVVELPGAVTGDMRFELMLDADVFVFPSYNEGQPTVLLEAMSAGLPIVTTDEGAIRDTIADGKNGYLVPKGDPAAIAERIIELLRDEPLRRRMGAASRRRFEERFRVETYGEGMADVFEAVVAGHLSLSRARQKE